MLALAFVPSRDDLVFDSTQAGQTRSTETPVTVTVTVIGRWGTLDLTVARRRDQKRTRGADQLVPRTLAGWTDSVA